jgi:carboxyl-terminal processing protease
LIGTETFSAAESFALDLKESGNAVFIGSPTGGDTGNGPETFTTQQGISFRIPTRKPAQVSPKGYSMEGKGIAPDHLIHLTVEDYLNNVDTVLEYAITVFR